MKSLKSRQHEFSESFVQLNVLSQEQQSEHAIPRFTAKMLEVGLYPLKPMPLEIMQINLGKMCNQVCKHCHVDAGPDRKEIMDRKTMELCLKAMDNSNIHTVDLTGGAPEMNPDFRWFVDQIHSRGKHILVRCNLTIILANKKYTDLPQYYAERNVEVVSSLPYFNAPRTDAQRGKGVFDKSIKALQMLNEVGYGQADTHLELNLVYNPSGAFLPGDQNALEKEFRSRLEKKYGIQFNNLFAITNLPVSRFLDYLIESGNYEEYMTSLSEAFNPQAAMGVMCRNMISVSWDGRLYDCDFNQMLELELSGDAPKHLSDFDTSLLENREIVLNQHCYGCTAGAGSSCGGTTA